MGAEAALAAILILYILGTLGYTGYLVFSLWAPERRQLARRKLVFALFIALCASGWAAVWWQDNFPAHLTIANLFIFGFLPALALGTLLAEISLRVAKLYARITNPKT